MSSSKVCKTAVESREEVRKEGTREDERREEGGQGGCELVSRHGEGGCAGPYQPDRAGYALHPQAPCG